MRGPIGALLFWTENRELRDYSKHENSAAELIKTRRFAKAIGAYALALGAAGAWIGTNYDVDLGSEPDGPTLHVIEATIEGGLRGFGLAGAVYMGVAVGEAAVMNHQATKRLRELEVGNTGQTL